MNWGMHQYQEANWSKKNCCNMTLCRYSKWSYHCHHKTICFQYLVEKYGPSDLQVMPDEDDYPMYLNWLFHSDATLTFPQTVVLRYKFQEPGVADAAVEGYSRWFVSRLKLLEKSLEDKEYLCSNRFTLADICVSYAINLAAALGIEQAQKPNIKRWSENLFSRPAFIKSKSFKYEPKD